jgi:large subunit ribosomal protein L5
MARLKELYKSSIVPELMKQFNYSSVMQVPKLLKITLNMGVGEAVGNKKVIEHAVEDMRLISGQKPVVTNAKKSIAGFKIRDGWPIGCMVTLRREHMYEFLDRLVSITLPRVRDFRGLNPKSFDGTGNYSMGLHEQIVFPEIDFDKIDGIRGLDICFTTSAKTNKEAKALLEAFNLPLKDRDKK